MRRSGYGIDDGVFYLLQDHLKSSSSFVNQSGATFTNNYYYPYGGNRGGAFSNLTTKRFTGQYHESSLPGGEGLSYYNARWDDPQVGRFLSADTIVPGPANPQAFNRYSCVFNNPLRFTDPTGHDPCDNGSRTCNSLNGGSRPTNIYLPIVTNQRSRPAAGSACPGSFVCLPPTPTAFPTPAPMVPRFLPTSTPGAFIGPPRTHMGEENLGSGAVLFEHYYSSPRRSFRYFGFSLDNGIRDEEVGPALEGGGFVHRIYAHVLGYTNGTFVSASDWYVSSGTIDVERLVYLQTDKSYVTTLYSFGEASQGEHGSDVPIGMWIPAENGVPRSLTVELVGKFTAQVVPVSPFINPIHSYDLPMNDQ